MVYNSAKKHRACLKFIQGEPCTEDCIFTHYCYWAEGPKVHWTMGDVGNLPTAAQVNSIRFSRGDMTDYVLDDEEFKPEQAPAQTPAQAAPTPVIVIPDDQPEEKESVKEPPSLKPCLRQGEWEKEKRGLDFQISALRYEMGAPNITESDAEKLQMRVDRAQAKLQEGQRRCDARDDVGDIRCGRADEGLPESTANEFRYILVPAKSWGEYNAADDDSVPGAIGRGIILDSHSEEQIQSMKNLFYQLVQGLAQPEGNSRKKGQFIPPPSCSYCATSMDYVTYNEVTAFNSGVPRGENYPNPCFRCMCVWYCSAKCKYGHLHHHSLACYRHPAYLTAVEILEENESVLEVGDAQDTAGSSVLEPVDTPGGEASGDEGDADI